MNIIEIIKNIINNCPFISSFSNGIHIDYTENKNGDFGLYSVNDELVKESITGEQYRRHSFILYANNQSINDYDRINNSTFLLDFGYWLETQKGATAKVYPNRAAYITKINSANAMVFDVSTEDINDGCTYQIQIFVNYTVTNSEYVDPDDVPGDEQPEVPPEEQPETPQIPILTVDGYDIYGLDDSFDEVVYFKGTGQYGWSSDDIRPLEYFKEHGIRCSAVIRRRGDVGYYLGSPELDYFDESDMNYMSPAPFDIWLPLPDYIS